MDFRFLRRVVKERLQSGKGAFVTALFHLSLLLFTSVSAAEFSSAERSWLEAHPRIRIGTYDRDAPYAIIDPEGGAVSGIAPDYLKLMLERLGLEVKVEWKFYSGRQIALKALKNGEIDLINPFYCGEAEAKESGVVVSKPVFGCSMSVLYRGDFTDRTMSVIASPYTRLGTSYVRENYPDAKVVQCLHAYDCIDHLLKGEATSVVMYTGALRTAAETYDMEFNIKSLNSLCGVAFATLPENMAAIGILNRGIDLIDKVSLNRLETHYFIAEPTKVSARRFFRSHPGYVFTATVFFSVTAIIVIVLVMQRRVARKTSAAKTAFLFSMSHDIRSPMNAILGFADIAAKKAKSIKGRARDEDVVVISEIEDCLQKTQKAGGLLLSLINSILDMSRIGSGKARLEEVEMDIRESFVDVESTLSEAAHAKNITMTFEFGDIVNRHVLADHARLFRIIMNFVSNAVKYTKDGGRVKVKCEEIRKVKSKGEKVKSADGKDLKAENSSLFHLSPLLFASRKPDGYVWFRYIFEDNGIGMSEEFQKHVFDQFSREHSTTASGVQGTGLGLSLCKSFVELMGGTIDCRSKQGVGTTFIVEIPFRVREEGKSKGEKVKSADGKDLKDENSSLSHLSPLLFTSKRVLLVEDNELNREVATYLLQEQGFKVDTADDGSVAVRLIREKGSDLYDYILMDIQMPIMGGYEATKIIRASGYKRPIIALSANAFAEDKAASIAAGMDDHIAKPIKINELLSVLSRHLS